MTDDIAIKVENLSKCYHIYDQPRDRLLQMLFRGHKQFYREFWALKDISFEVKKGETVGIIGRNGSGKSTLLQLICGTLNPTKGSIQTNGRIAALLELGSGFNPEFTGRENIYMNGVLFGFNRTQIDERFEEIASFADIGDFIDQPLNTYSSGMLVRLAFAVVAYVEADILVIDEALAVGDAFFQQKCMRFLRGFKENEGTVLFVSHDAPSVLSLCDRAILLCTNNSGIEIGDPTFISRIYLRNLYSDPERENNNTKRMEGIINEEESDLIVNGARCRTYAGKNYNKTNYLVSRFNPAAERFGLEKGMITDAGFINEKNEMLSSIISGQPVSFFIKAIALEKIHLPAFGFMIKNSLGEYVYAEGTDRHFREHRISLNHGDISTAVFSFLMPEMLDGQYFVNVAFAEGLGDDHTQQCWMHDSIHINAINGRLVHGYSGLNEIQMKIIITQEL